MLTGFDTLIIRASSKRDYPNQNPDRLGLPIKQYVVDNLENLTKDPLATAVFERIDYFKFDENQRFAVDFSEDIKRQVKDVYAEMYIGKLPADPGRKVEYLEADRLAKHQVLYAQLCRLKADILATPNYFDLP